jgi:hypothetical protein
MISRLWNERSRVALVFVLMLSEILCLISAVTNYKVYHKQPLTQIFLRLCLSEI